MTPQDHQKVFTFDLGLSSRLGLTVWPCLCERARPELSGGWHASWCRP
jgi:hypothetical protein